MYIPTFEDIKSALALLTCYKTVTEYGPKAFQYLIAINKRSMYDLDEILPELIKEKIALGQIIECAGFLSKYSQTFLPKSYTNLVSIFDKDCTKKQNNKITNLSFTITIPPPPVNVIPSLQNYQLCFLFPEDFKTFVSPYDNIDRTIFNVHKSNKPFPVLVDTIKHQQFINKFVNIKARLINLPNNFIGNLEQIYTDRIILEYNKNFFNPYYEGGSILCLSLLQDETKIEEITSKKPNLEAPIFTEIHIEGLEKLTTDEINNLLTASIPDLNSAGFTYTDNKNEVVTYCTLRNIIVTFRPPATIGFYAITELFHNDNYAKSISELQRYMKTFNREFQNTSLNVTGIRPSIKTDFVFDPTKAKLLDSRGLLNIDFEDFNPNIQDTARWYKNAK